VIKEKCEKCDAPAIVIHSDVYYCAHCYADKMNIKIEEKNESTTNNEF
jgi:Zn finger protein HypA/HybF involved in hydrogenase expression